MFRNYLKIALRNLSAHKGFSAINIIGLALGMTCSLLILLWIRDERSMDAFHKNGDRLFAIYERMYINGTKAAGYGVPGPLPAEMKRVLPDVEAATGYAWNTTNTFSVGDKTLKEEGNAASPDYFRMFSYPLLEGNARDALGTQESIAISRTMAESFFGSASAAIGKTIRYDNKKDLIVKAVFEDLPATASMRFNFLINWDFEMSQMEWMRDWGNSGPSAMVLLKQGADPAKFAKQIDHFLDTYNRGQSGKFHLALSIQPYRDIYLHSHFEEDHLSGGRIEYVHLFGLVAIAILLIACINFMNLTTARSLRRAKEIGVRKVMGAVRPLLIRQFIGEAVLMSLLSAALALILTALVLPVFNELTAKHILFPSTQLPFWLLFVALALLTGIVSGSYPALFLSSFSPIRVLKGGTPGSGRSLWLRKGLVVFQFVLSIVLIVSTLLVSRQVRYVQRINLGYNRQNLLYVPMEGDLIGKQEVFMSEALRRPGISAITRISQSPTNIDNGTAGVDWQGKDPSTSPMFTQASIGYDFVGTMGLQMAAGRDFSKNFITDSVGYILNESAAHITGYKDPIGQPLTFWGKRGKIIGVIKDFHFQSLHTAIRPLVFRLGHSDEFSYFLVRTESGKTREALQNLQQLCKDLNPRFPFTYSFSDDEYTKLYEGEELVGRLSIAFSALAILISCLGLLGLSIFSAEQRVREISIRKVLGASMGSLFGLLSGEFLVLVGVAFAIAIPLSWWAMHQWLQHFAYRTDINWSLFAVSGVASVLIALATVSFQAIRVARANPAKTLRAE